MTGEYSLVLGTGVSMRLDRRNAQPDSDDPLWLLTRPLPADSEQLGQSQSLVDLDEDTTGLELWETAAFRLCRWVDDSSLAGRPKLAKSATVTLTLGVLCARGRLVARYMRLNAEMCSKKGARCN